jgi:hypothetical protein
MSSASNLEDDGDMLLRNFGIQLALKQRHIPKERTLQWEIDIQIIQKVNRYNFGKQTEKR